MLTAEANKSMGLGSGRTKKRTKQNEKERSPSSFKMLIRLKLSELSKVVLCEINKIH